MPSRSLDITATRKHRIRLLDCFAALHRNAQVSSPFSSLTQDLYFTRAKLSKDGVRAIFEIIRYVSGKKRRLSGPLCDFGGTVELNFKQLCCWNASVFSQSFHLRTRPQQKISGVGNPPFMRFALCFMVTDPTITMSSSSVLRTCPPISGLARIQNCRWCWKGLKWDE